MREDHPDRERATVWTTREWVEDWVSRAKKVPAASTPSPRQRASTTPINPMWIEADVPVARGGSEAEVLRQMVEELAAENTRLRIENALLRARQR